jgi:hypothetical protein
MQTKVIFRWAWALLLLVALSLGCKLADGVSQVVAVATQVDLEARVTEFEMGPLPTGFDVGSLATEMESFATEFDMSAVETQMGALATEIDLEQMLTQVPALQGTLVAFATPSGFPADIPLLEGERLILGGAADSLQYAARSELAQAVEFYRREMAARGWVESPGSRASDHAAVLVFELADRTVKISIAEDFFFGVIVSIQVEG